MAFNFLYTALGLTAAINQIPNVYGLLGDMNVSPGRGLASTTVRVDIQGSEVTVLPAVARGGPSTLHQRVSDKAVLIEIPHFPYMDTITPADIQDFERVQNGQLASVTVEDELNRRLTETRAPHDQTLEYMRVGALKGLVTDGAGNTLLDMYSAFDITQVSFDLDLDNANADVIGICSSIYNHITDNLLGESFTEVQIPCSTSAFNRLISHPKVEKYWLNQEQATSLANMVRTESAGTRGRRFAFQNLVFIEYHGKVTKADRTTVEPLIADQTGHAFAAGMRSGWETFFAPAHDIREVNTIGQHIYVSPKELDHGEGIELKTQSNALSVLKKIDATALIVM
ncbi:MAG: major capsid protein [Pseudomonadota bacterium]